MNTTTLLSQLTSVLTDKKHNLTIQKKELLEELDDHIAATINTWTMQLKGLKTAENRDDNAKSIKMYESATRIIWTKWLDRNVPAVTDWYSQASELIYTPLISSLAASVTIIMNSHNQEILNLLLSSINNIKSRVTSKQEGQARDSWGNADANYYSDLVASESILWFYFIRPHYHYPKTRSALENLYVGEWKDARNR